MYSQKQSYFNNKFSRNRYLFKNYQICFKFGKQFSIFKNKKLFTIPKQFHSNLKGHEIFFFLNKK